MIIRKINMSKRIFGFLALCFFITACAAEEASTYSIEKDIKDDLKSYLLAQYEAVKLSEIHTKNEDKLPYLRSALGDSFINNVIAVSARDLYFKEISAASEVHLGIAIVRYETSDKAKLAISKIEKKGFFENTKILTQYVAVNKDEINIVMYTESSANKVVLKYLDDELKKFSK